MTFSSSVILPLALTVPHVHGRNLDPVVTLTEIPPEEQLQALLSSVGTSRPVRSLFLVPHLGPHQDLETHRPPAGRRARAPSHTVAFAQRNPTAAITVTPRTPSRPPPPLRAHTRRNHSPGQSQHPNPHARPAGSQFAPGASPVVPRPRRRSTPWPTLWKGTSPRALLRHSPAPPVTLAPGWLSLRFPEHGTQRADRGLHLRSCALQMTELPAKGPSRSPLHTRGRPRPRSPAPATLPSPACVVISLYVLLFLSLKTETDRSNK